MKIKRRSGSGLQQRSVSSPGPLKRILCWSDSPTASTGFGAVAAHILRALYDTGEYDIDVIGINFNASFYDKKKFPYTILPATMTFSGSQRDPYGNALLVKTLAEKHYDILFVLNDSFAVNDVAKFLRELQEKKVASNINPFKIIYYFPVDCRIRQSWTGMMKIADRLVAYNKYGAAKAKEVGVVPTDIVPHGADINNFKPISATQRRQIRHEIFHITDDNIFLLANVNRNSLRKDIAKTILAFNEFKKLHSNSRLYLHTAVVDGMYCGGIDLDLTVPCEELGLEIGRDVMFPSNYTPTQGVPIGLLNGLYNAADACITTTLGEGYGLTVGPEAMAAGVPIIVPESTSFKEIVGEDGERGYVFPCKEKTFIDSSGFRPTARLEDIVRKIEECYSERWSNRQKEIIKRANEFAIETSWENINKKWIQLFNEVSRIDKKKEILLVKREKEGKTKDIEWL